MCKEELALFPSKGLICVLILSLWHQAGVTHASNLGAFSVTARIC